MRIRPSKPDCWRGTVPTAVAVALTSSLAACEAHVDLVEPGGTGGEGSLLIPIAADSALAERAGWANGVPGTTVFVRRNEDPVVYSFVADEDGRIELPRLPAASYWVWAEKHPSAAELAEPVSSPPALGGGRRTSLQRGSQQMVELAGHEDGSLVISEFYYHRAPLSVFGYDGVNYQYHWYVELCNNSDSTIFLDGIIFGAGFDAWLDIELWPCAETEEFRSEPRGVYSQRFQAFPGSGTEHPLPPGRAVVIAEQAIDHSALYPGFPDLRAADFQFHWETRALNPEVLTMLPIQLSTGVHETMFLARSNVAFVAKPLDTNSLERRRGRFQGDFALFPREAILDLAVLYSQRQLTREGAPMCANLVHPSLDALGAFVMPHGGDDVHLLSAHRKLLPDGSRLQRTGVSAADWIMAPRSPGRVP